MGKVKKSAVLKEEVPLEVYPVGNLKFKCHCCGHKHTVEEGVQGGIRFDLYATNKHKLSLACPKCKALLELYFEKGVESPIIGLDGKAMKATTPPVDYGMMKEEVDLGALYEHEEETSTSEAYDMDPAPELPEELKEEIINTMGEQDEISVQEENKQEASV